MSESRRPRTLAEKVWDRHVVHHRDGQDLLYVDLHLVHEVTSPQAFEGLRLAGRRVRRPAQVLASVDHNVSTGPEPPDEMSLLQLEALRHNCADFGVRLHDLAHPGRGIVHVIAPELGFTRPGMVVACGDSHTSTHGAFGALGLGIGTTDVEHVLATQCLWIRRPLSMLVELSGVPGPGVSAKDLALAVIARIEPGGASGHIIEFSGDSVCRMSMEERMTLCNLSVEAGARAAVVAPDRTTFEYLRGRPHRPVGAELHRAEADWESLVSDVGAEFARTLRVDAASVEPTVTWGTSPGQSVPVSGTVPEPDAIADEAGREAVARALRYMDLEPGMPVTQIRIDRVFLGSCTNGRIEDLQAAAAVLGGRRVAPGVRMLVVPGSWRVRVEAERLGLDRLFREAGAEWREPGCSMCLGMNPDVLGPGERCASTSNRNFEGRQGAGGRTHLVSPAMAAAAAVTGRLADVRELLGTSV
ncbi:MAG: 3-isopropylmalate dehydratase large subunit [Candidatus Dormibacteria bacterium]